MYRVPHLILVDDDGEVLQMLQLFFASLNVTVTAFSNPVQAFECIQYHLDEIDGVLSDLHMQPLSGIELLKKVRCLDETLPFYLMSAEASKEEVLPARASKLTAFYEKSAVYTHLKWIVDSLRPQNSISSLQPDSSGHAIQHTR
jgi:DNA-binding NtrC family response regulator